MIILIPQAYFIVKGFWGLDKYDKKVIDRPKDLLHKVWARTNTHNIRIGTDLKEELESYRMITDNEERYEIMVIQQSAETKVQDMINEHNLRLRRA